jgi:HEAT repeat protein
MQALGRIGPAASNAVEVLTEIATSDHQSRLTAVTALGLLRGAARPAAPALVPLLRDEDEQIRINSARALVHIGLTPDKAVPALKRMLLDTNEWTRMVATMGLWNHDRSDTNLQAAISSWLRSPDRNRSPVVFSLGCLGTNAAPFLPEIESSFGDPDPNVRRFAAQAVRRIRDGEP